MIKALATFLALAICIQMEAQTTYLQLGQLDYSLIDRLETKSGRLSNDLFLSVKPIPRKGLVNFIETIERDTNWNMNALDRYNLDHIASVSGEWGRNGDRALLSKKPILKHFYTTQPNLFHVNTGDFFLAVNPVISATAIMENSNAGTNTLLSNSRGVELRGWISKKVGFYTFVTDNQEELVSYAGNYVANNNAVPGADYYQTPNATTVDYLQARGYIDFAAVKDHINISLGYDKFFLGDGVRSLFLSDFGASAPFLRINTKIWKLNYQNIFLELTPQYVRGVDRVLPRKYATMHHLSANVTKWLNLGLFEAIMFARPDRYEFSYMVPIIFYRQIERANGSPDNAFLGANFKAIVAKKLQVYGQIALDEFTAKELVAGDGYWANKFGLQLGAKYFDAFGIQNLDLQAEANLVRPFTYTHYDTVANYSHYNQPLAHPLGAGFGELLGVARYQATEKLFVSLTGMYYKQGVDSNGTNYGSNIFRDYQVRTPSTPGGSTVYGYGLTNGVQTACTYIDLNLAYELKENLFIEAGGVVRNYKYLDGVFPDQSSKYVYFGIRLNAPRRNFMF